MALEPGTMVADYRLRRLLGEGGMGRVWEAAREGGDAVALKVLHDDGDEEARRRLLREARAARAVKHPHVVVVEDLVETADGAPVLVMELLEGETLADRLARDKPMSAEAVAELMLPVVSAVGAAHARGVVHRDLKPSNVFLAEDGVKVMDFGIAKQVVGAGEQTQLTASGAMLGTPCYMAPEQAFGERDIDDRADVWALGIMLYEALSGLLPTKADNVGQVLKVILTRTIWPLADAAPDLPAALTALVDRMLSRERGSRPELEEVMAVLHSIAPLDVPTFERSAVKRGDGGATEDGSLREETPHEDALPEEVATSSRVAATGSLPGRLMLLAAVCVVGGVGWSLTQERAMVLQAAGVIPDLRRVVAPVSSTARPEAPEVEDPPTASPPTPPTAAPRPPAPATTGQDFDPLRERR